MSNALAVHQGGGSAVSRYDEREYIETIKQTVCKGATDAQLRVFVEVCKSTGLNPFLKEIWYVAEKGLIMAARDGYLRVANEHPMFDGIETRVERDKDNRPIKAVCTVYRKDRNHPTICEAYFNEYNKQSPVWRQYPSAMIGKVAEVLALKRSFSINGVVTEEEIGEQRGSREAQEQVAETKIKMLTSGSTPEEAHEAVAEVVPTDEGPPTEIEEQLRESIKQAKEAKAAKDGEENEFKRMLKAFQGLKERFADIGKSSEYYRVLGAHGIEHSNQFHKFTDARACYKEMQILASDLEAQHKDKSVI